MVFETTLHFLALIVFPPLFLGIIAKTKAWAAGKKGPPLFQVYFDLLKLIRKGQVASRSSSVVFRAAPFFVCAFLFTAGFIFPLTGSAPVHFWGDIILFVYLFAGARFVMILAAMDVGSSFEGMGASREAFFGALSEIAFFMGLVVLAVITHSTSLEEIFAWQATGRQGTYATLQPSLLLVFIAFILLLLVENSRMPVDDPNTHLELTMIHEVMILDYSGPELGFLLYGASLKLFLFMILTVSVLWPQTAESGGGAMALLLLKGGLMAAAIGVIESVTARVRLKKIPGLLMANFVVVVLALLVALLGKES